MGTRLIQILTIAATIGAYAQGQAQGQMVEVPLERNDDVEIGDLYDDTLYLNKTGKTREELIDSGEYIPMDIFIRPISAPKTLSPEQIRLNNEAATQAARKNTFFNLYTIKNPGNPQNVTLDPASFKNTHWDPNRKVVILIHGLNQNGNDPGMPIAVKDAYLENDFNLTPNVICVDWGTLTGPTLSYWNVGVPNTYWVGNYVGDFLVFLKDSQLIPNFNSIHIVGFSLGGQVAGVAGRRVLNKKGILVGRITGLDPAGPGFEASVDKEKRLDPEDAAFVDIIHTNMGDLNPLTGVNFGTMLESGDIDFYPNGGESQPACKSIWNLGNLVGTCSHNKAPEYFANSVRGKLYLGCPCVDWRKFRSGICRCYNPTPMGETCDGTRSSSRGKYYLKI